MKQSHRITSTVLAASLFATPILAETQQFDFTDFDQLEISAGIEVDIVAGPDFSIMAEARNSRALNKLVIELRGNTLYASRKSGIREMLFGGNSHVQLTITMPELHDIDVSSGVDAHITGNLSDVFSGTATSGASIEIDNLNAQTVRFNVSSGSNITATGTCGFLGIAASSGAEFDSPNLICETVDVSASSGASATVFASERVESRASSGGSVDVYGSPEQTDITESSGGDVDLMD